MDNVLSAITMNVRRGDPFQFSAPGFGVQVEVPAEQLEGENAFTPNLTGLFIQIMNMTMDDLTNATVSLDYTLLNGTSNGSVPRVSAAIYGSDTFFQERTDVTAERNREVGSIIIDISLRSSINGSVMDISRPDNSNIVRPTFEKKVNSMLYMYYVNESTRSWK